MAALDFPNRSNALPPAANTVPPARKDGQAAFSPTVILGALQQLTARVEALEAGRG